MKKRLTRIDLRALRHEIYVQYVTEVLYYIVLFGAGAIGIKALYDQLVLLFKVVTDNLDYLRKSGYTEKLKRQDRRRDNIARGLTATIKSYLYDPDSSVHDAAVQLMIIFDHYWSLPKRTYDAETAAISDLLRELSLPENVAYVTLLGLAHYVYRLATANADFTTLMHDRYDQTIQRPEISMKDARAAATVKFSEIVDRVEGIIIVNGIDFTPELANFVKEFNAVTTRYKNILKQEQGRRKAAAAGSDDDETEEIEDDNNVVEAQ